MSFQIINDTISIALRDLLHPELVEITTYAMKSLLEKQCISYNPAFLFCHKQLLQHIHCPEPCSVDISTVNKLQHLALVQHINLGEQNPMQL